jgi:ATP-dependent Clp protease protease subunit
VSTIAVGYCASMASVLLAGGTKGKRFALPHADVMIHQGSAGFQGTTRDIEVRSRWILRLVRRRTVCAAPRPPACGTAVPADGSPIPAN